MSTIWNIFDPDTDVLRSARNLPHWDQTGALTFVTMRLADSMPKEIVTKWHDEIELRLAEHGFSGRKIEEILADPTVNSKTREDLKRFKRRRWHGHLDDCHGECPLRRPKLAKEVAKSLLHFNKVRYDLERFVVMPNHAHVLVQMRAGYTLRKEFSGIMRFSGRAINALIGKTGRFWQSEPFDHIVRSLNQFRYLQQYIYDNPSKAKLSKGEYVFWKHDVSSDDSESRTT